MSARSLVAIVGLVLCSQAFAARAETNWPMRLTTAQGPVLIFQPQIEEFRESRVKFWVAVSVGDPGQEEAVYGAVWVEGRVQTDTEARTLRLVEARIRRYRFGPLDAPHQRNLAQAIQPALASGSVVLSLGEVVAAAAVAQKQAQEVEDLPVVVPKIVFREHPAILVSYEGTPLLTAVEDTSLFRVTNTPFFLVLDAETKAYYLQAGGAWFRASDALGPFEHAREVPQRVAALLEAGLYRDPEQALTGQQAAAVEIVTATEPAELICTDGPAKLAVISGTNLLYVTNTDADVFVSIETQKLYVVVAGRWYEASRWDGPWAYLPADRLPEDFRRIPSDSPKADVLAHVPETPTAQEAVEQAQLPQIKAVDRRRAAPPKVVYDGTPRFEVIEGLPISYAVNTFSPVLRIDRRYYLCEDGVWWVSSSAFGPWKLCERLPAEVYLIPPTCPVYPVRFVYILGSTPQRVYVGWTGGYRGCYAWRGIVVYGTGCRYRPWYGQFVILRPATFGVGARYSIRSGDWGFAFGMVFGRSVLWEVWYRDPCWAGWFGFGGYRPIILHEHVRWVSRPPRHYRPDWHRGLRQDPAGQDRDLDRPGNETPEPRPVVQRSLTTQGAAAIDLDRKFQDGWERTRPRSPRPQPDPRLVQPAPSQQPERIQEPRRQDGGNRRPPSPGGPRPQPDPRPLEPQPSDDRPPTQQEDKPPLFVLKDKRMETRPTGMARLEILRRSDFVDARREWHLSKVERRNPKEAMTEMGGIPAVRVGGPQVRVLPAGLEGLLDGSESGGWLGGLDRAAATEFAEEGQDRKLPDVRWRFSSGPGRAEERLGLNRR